MAELKRSMKVVPGWDCITIQPCVHGSPKCKPETGGSHGRHSAEMYMSVLGHEAEVIFGINTGWYPRLTAFLPISGGIEVMWHTAWPQEGQSEEDRNEPDLDATCKDWDSCYRQSSGTTANDLFDMLVTRGSEAVYEWLEEEHRKLVKGQ